VNPGLVPWPGARPDAVSAGFAVPLSGSPRRIARPSKSALARGTCNALAVVLGGGEETGAAASAALVRSIIETEEMEAPGSARLTG